MAYKRRRVMTRKRPYRRRARTTRRFRKTRGTRLRSFKRRARMAIGVSKKDMNHTHTSLMAESNANFRNTFPIATQSLYGCDATRISKMTSAFNRSDRFFQQVDFRGVSYHFLVRNNLPDPVVFNYALISFKNDQYPLTNATWPAEPYQCPALAADGFFRYNGDSRDENFDNGISAVMQCYAPISTDQYNVHMHKRVTLAGKPGGTDWTFTYANNYRRIKGYVPIKRILRYNDDTDSICENPIYLVYWICPFHQDSGAARILQACYVQQLHVAYFRQVT